MGTAIPRAGRIAPGRSGLIVVFGQVAQEQGLGQAGPLEGGQVQALVAAVPRVPGFSTLVIRISASGKRQA